MRRGRPTAYSGVMRPRSWGWWAAAVLAALLGVSTARHFYRPDHVTLPPPEDAGPRQPPSEAPPALG